MKTIPARLAAIGLILLALVACSTANTTASEVAMQYGAGPFDSRTFVKCVPTNTLQRNDVNDDHFYYPAGQRDFNFNNNQGSDAAPMTSATKDPVEIKVSGTVKLTLDTSCAPFKAPDGRDWPGGKLQMFHELIAGPRGAAGTEGTNPMPDGWRNVLRDTVGAAIDRAVDNEGLKYGYLELYTNEEKKRAWERDVLAQIPTVLRTLTQNVDLFRIDAVLLQKPEVPGKIVDGFNEVQAAELRAQAVAVDKREAAGFPGGLIGYQAYQQQQAVNQAIKDGKVQVLPVPQGSPVIVQGK